jgi:hypothetical protein
MLASLFLTAAAGANERLFLVDSSGDELWEIDPTNASGALVGSISGGIGTPGALAYDPFTDTMYLSDTSLDSLFTIDYTNAAATLVGPYNRQGVDPVMHGLEFNTGNRTLYGVDFRDKALVEINQGTGQADFIGITPLTGFGSLAWNADTGTMYGGDSGTDSLWNIDITDGSGTLVGAFGQGSSLGTGMAWSPTHGLIGIDNVSDSLYSINEADGSATLIGALPAGVTNPLGIAFVTEIPAPGAALVLGLWAVAGARRRREA